MILLYLFAAHALADFPLQGDFLTKGKNRFNPLPGVPWYWCMMAHCLIHAGAVTLITGKWWLGVAEFMVHFVVDDLKCGGHTTFDEDQHIHYFCKVVWWLLLTHPL